MKMVFLNWTKMTTLLLGAATLVSIGVFQIRVLSTEKTWTGVCECLSITENRIAQCDCLGDGSSSAMLCLPRGESPANWLIVEPEWLTMGDWTTAPNRRSRLFSCEVINDR